MTRIKDILEPGEAIAIEVPDRRTRYKRQGVVALLLVLEWGNAIAADVYSGSGTYPAAFFFSVFYVLVGVRWSRWRVLDTDRRLLYRKGPLLSRQEENRLDEIDEVHREAGAFYNRIIVRANGRDTTITVYMNETAPILKALGGKK